MRVTPYAVVAVIGVLATAGGCASAGPRSFPAAQQVVRAPLEVAPRTLQPAEDYRIGAHDILALRIYELEKPGEVASLELEVSGEGQIAVPFVGLIHTVDKTVADVRRAIIESLGARYLVDPQVTLSVKEYRSRMIAVMGDVAHPGVFYLNRNRVTLLEALSLAGGLSKGAGTRAIVLRPSDTGQASPQDATPIDLVAAILGGDPAANVDIEPGMVVQVPAAEEYFVMGYVNKPGAFPYQRPTTVLQAVAIAGGLEMRHASPSVVMVKRITSTGTQVIQVDVSEIAEGKAPDVAIAPGDTIEAGRTVAWAIVSDVLDSVRGIFGMGINAGAL